MGVIKIYTDGSSFPNPNGISGFVAIIKISDEPDIILTGSEFPSTNNRAELLGAIIGLEYIQEKSEIQIVSDSEYLVLGINQRIYKWQGRQWKNVKNDDLWRKVYKLMSFHRVSAHHVKGHAGHLENELCDGLANEARIKKQEELGLTKDDLKKIRKQK